MASVLETTREADTAFPNLPPFLSPPPPRPDISLGYVAGFDGLRALGLLTMLAYHHGIGAARGGIFTVSMFFTLSGFLIATLTLAEWSAQGRLSLRRFWERRARRLLPAAVVTVVGVVVLQWVYGVGSGARFRGDVLSALGYVANWRMAYSDADYGAIFAIESPVQHFWSLAVEEQFYVAFPLMFVGLMAATRGRWRIVGAAFGLGAVASFAAAWLVASRHGNSGLAYYATYTRVSEILVGVTLAFVVATTPARRFLASPFGVRTTRAAGAAGLVGLAWLWHTVGLTSPWVFRGATALNAVLTSLVVVACVSPAPGLLARSIGVWPLRSLGRISYAVYLFHWPLFLLLDHQRTGFGYRTLFVVRVAATVGLAVVSHHVVESPFRFRLRMPRPRLTAVLAGAAGVAAGLALVVPVGPSTVVELANFGDTDVTPQTVVTPEEPTATAATRVLLVGDSVAWTTAPGMNTWNKHHADRPIQVDTFVSMGCTLAEPGPTQFLGQLYEVWPDCATFRQNLADTLRSQHYDVVMVVMGHKDLGEREVDGEWRHLGDPVFDEWFRGQVGGFADILGASGTPVLWASVTHTRVVPRDSTASWTEFANNEPERADRLNEIVAEVVTQRPGIEILDVSGWLQGAPGGEYDRAYRADTVHWTFAGSDAAAEWIVPRVLAAAGA